MRRYFAWGCALVLVTSSALAAESVAPRVEGTAIGSDTALEIARRAAVARYGETHIRGEEPLTARLNQRGNWVVSGTMPEEAMGGVIEVEVAGSSGKILQMVHGQ
ncbi:hypothetical protein JJE66_09165 [Bradyrhizobium diazoefficiens]|uniref:NTF2 fold immunity protein n=1 Tax=Bradyrhizobium diazoefficiens TaxID=1355477 RepID=UPI00190C0EA6|nr:NTF2 fold immunity protein [Bradyrhizobium diazoefficiens]MBK3661420.1 hypothetical protein [Bradyrhizobium diazoefficiens]